MSVSRENTKEHQNKACQQPGQPARRGSDSRMPTEPSVARAQRKEAEKLRSAQPEASVALTAWRRPAAGGRGDREREREREGERETQRTSRGRLPR